jgi:hypothetical protein
MKGTPTMAIENPANASANAYCVVYRRGGSANFSWHRSLPMSKEEAQQARANTERMGYKAMMVNYRLSMSVGLPETYE